MNLTPEQREKLRAAAEAAVANPFCQDDRDEVARKATPSVILALLAQVEQLQAELAQVGHPWFKHHAPNDDPVTFIMLVDPTAESRCTPAPAEPRFKVEVMETFMMDDNYSRPDLDQTGEHYIVRIVDTAVRPKDPLPFNMTGVIDLFDFRKKEATEYWTRTLGEFFAASPPGSAGSGEQDLTKLRRFKCFNGNSWERDDGEFVRFADVEAMFPDNPTHIHQSQRVDEWGVESGWVTYTAKGIEKLKREHDGYGYETQYRTVPRDKASS